MKINRFTLDNGLRVVHCHLPHQSRVAVNTLFYVGSRDENPQMTGIAHLFEHLMFGGSTNIPDFDGPLTAAGGYSNAWTSADFTNFYDVIDARNIETVLWLESDRLMRAGFTPEALRVQKSVVIEEFKQVCLNRPYGDLEHLLQGEAYKVHPYRTPVIGRDFSHIEKVGFEDALEWFGRHYAPNNAVLSVCGNIDVDALRPLVEKWYGDIPPASIAPRDLPAEPEQTAPRRVATSGNVPETLITLSYPMARFGTSAYFCADLLSDILANGKASRFNRRLLMGTDLFSNVDASISGTVDPGQFLITATLRTPGETNEKLALEAIEEQLGDLREAPVAPRDLERCINRIESLLAFQLIDPEKLAFQLAKAEMLGFDATRLIAPYLAITPDRLRAEAARLFTPTSATTLIYRPI